MYKRLLFIITLVLSTYAYTQNLDYLKTQDTIFIVLKDTRKSFNKEYKGFTFTSTVYPGITEYIMRETDTKAVLFQIQGNSRDKIVKKKKLFNDCGDNFIDMDFIERTGPGELFAFQFGLTNGAKKVFYIIDEKDLKKRKILLRQVFIVTAFYTTM